MEQLKVQEHLVIVVAEGAGDGVLDLDDLKDQAEVDESGNKKLPVFPSLFRTLGHSSKWRSSSIVKKMA